MCTQCWIDADDLRICLAIRKAWITVKGIAANTGGVRQRFAILLVQQNTDRKMKRMMPLSLEPFEQLLDSRFMGEGRIRVRLFRRRLSRIFSAQTVNVVKFFGRLVMGLERIVLQRPGRGNPVRVPDFVEVAFSEPQQNGAVYLTVAAHEIMKARMKAFAVRAVPGLRRLIASIHEYGLAVPILAFARQVAAALQQKDALSRLCQPPPYGAAAGAGANNDDIVMVRDGWSPGQTTITFELRRRFSVLIRAAGNECVWRLRGNPQ